MIKHTKLIEETEGEEHLHKDVWRVLQRQIEYAEAKGALYDGLIAMVFAFHTIDGYLNYLGERITPDLWGDEKVVFKENDVTDKLALCKRCSLAAPDYGKRPYGTVSKLKKAAERCSPKDAHDRRQDRIRRTQASALVPKILSVQGGRPSVRDPRA